MKTHFLRNLLVAMVCIFLFTNSLVVSKSLSTDDPIRSGDYVYYVLQDGTIRIDAYYGGDEELIIPEKIDNYVFSAIGRYGAYWYFNTGMKFQNTKSVYIPKTVVDFAYGRFFLNFDGWKLKNIYFDEQNPLYHSEDGIVYNKDMTKLVFYPRGKEESTLKIPDTVTSIEYGAIKWYGTYESLCDVYIHENVVNIDNRSFENCTNLTLHVYANSYGLEWAQNHNFKYVIMEEEQDINLGDVNNDKRITINDVTAIQRHIAEINTLSESGIKAADVNRDNQVTIIDATLIQQYLAEFIEKF